MMLLELILIVLGCCGLARGGTALDTVNVCQCRSPEDAVVECQLKRGSVLKAKGCGDRQGDILRVTGPGFVVRLDEDVAEKFKTVVLEKTTLSCEDFTNTANTKMIINNADCGLELEEPTATTTTTKKIPTKEPKPRPPAKPEPVDEDGDDDDDDNNGDNDGSTTITTNATTTTVTTTSAMSTTLTVITVTATAAFREWWLILGIGVLITSIGVVIIVKVRMLRRARTNQPVQVQEVTSTSHEPQRTYVLRKTPRSPRRRRSDSMNSMDSIVLYAVGEEEDTL